MAKIHRILFFTGATINGWTLDGGSQGNTEDATFNVDIAENDAGTLFTVTMAQTGGTLGSYSIETQTTNGQFEVGSANGQVSLASGQTIDRETVASTEIVIEIM